MREYVAPVEVGAHMAVGAAAPVVAGYAGAIETAVRAPFQGRDVAVAEGAETVEAIKGAPSHIPMSEEAERQLGQVGEAVGFIGRGMEAASEFYGDAVMEYTGNPELATIAYTMPEAAIEALGLGFLRRTSRAADAAIEATKRRKLDPDLTPERQMREIANDLEPEDMTSMEIVDALVAKKSKKVAEQVRPDPEIMAAAEKLGIDINPAHYSTSEAYIRVEQAIKALPESQLGKVELDALKKLGEKADELVTDFGADLDRGMLDTRVQQKYERTITRLEEGAERLYTKVGEVIGPATKVVPEGSRAYIDKVVENVAGDLKRLSKPEKALYDMFQTGKPITYEALDRIRRQLARGYKRKGKFKDADKGELDQVYKVLIKDQQGFADGMKVGEEFAAARQAVQTRKGIEAQAQQIVGKELNQSLLPQLKSAAGALTRGQIDKFQKLMRNTPAALRQQTAASLLSELFTTGGRTAGNLGSGFAKAYEMLQRNKGAADELFKYLPAEARSRFDAIGKLSSAIARAEQIGKATKQAPMILEALQDLSMVARLTGYGARPLAYATAGQLGGPAGDALAAAAKQTAQRATAADKLMTSPSFQRFLNQAMEGKVKAAEMILKRSPAWQAWRNTLGEGTKTQLAAVGPIAWLTEPQGDDATVPREMIEPQPTPTPEPGTVPPNPALTPPPEALGGVPGGQ